MTDLNLCQAAKFPTNPYDRCVLTKNPGHKYCLLHMTYDNIIDFIAAPDYINQYINQDVSRENTSKTYNPIIHTHIIKPNSEESVEKKTLMKKKAVGKNTAKRPMKKGNTTIDTKKESSIVEDDTSIKLLILTNNDSYVELVKGLVGPVWDDLTLSEDSADPVTLDTFWTMENGIKVRSKINKYHLFSYIDSKNKIRCVTIFTLYDLVVNDKLAHPVTKEKFSVETASRARELIDFYKEKVGILEKNRVVSIECKIKNKLTRLFSRFHQHNVFFEVSWLTNIKKEADLIKIIKGTNQMIKNNLTIINPEISISDFKLFNRVHKGKNTIAVIQEYIVDNWIELVDLAPSENQVPMWIIAHGLSLIFPAIKDKYPEISLMF